MEVLASPLVWRGFWIYLFEFEYNQLCDRISGCNLHAAVCRAGTDIHFWPHADNAYGQRVDLWVLCLLGVVRLREWPLVVRMCMLVRQ